MLRNISNQERCQCEGRFQIVLPHNAAISRFAMKIGNRLQEGEVLEKQCTPYCLRRLFTPLSGSFLEIDSSNRFSVQRLKPYLKNYSFSPKKNLLIKHDEMGH
ncbi:VIT domain-containing protein [Candidatus Parabeggiatoa sp. HSG14]|uniref:VIT domain-containing protein n=1 Tax=Candidatus Parabeggiatoa sp. HSG14 TaxID=3055593 RepID=UPI0025A8C77E|nr:VIT domain-containing protein [Thiotrichales bacterium HSG14]